MCHFGRLGVVDNLLLYEALTFISDIKDTILSFPVVGSVYKWHIICLSYNQTNLHNKTSFSPGKMAFRPFHSIERYMNLLRFIPQF